MPSWPTPLENPFVCPFYFSVSVFFSGQLNKSRRIHRVPDELRFDAEKIFAAREEKNG